MLCLIALPRGRGARRLLERRVNGGDGGVDDGLIGWRGGLCQKNKHKIN